MDWIGQELELTASKTYENWIHICLQTRMELKKERKIIGESVLLRWLESSIRIMRTIGMNEMVALKKIKQDNV